MSFAKGGEKSSMRNINEFHEIEEINKSVEEISKTTIEEISADINVEVIFIKLVLIVYYIALSPYFCMTF